MSLVRSGLMFSLGKLKTRDEEENGIKQKAGVMLVKRSGAEMESQTLLIREKHSNSTY